MSFSFTSEHFYIRSNKYSTQERQTKRGRVYDVFFRVVTLDGREKQKKLSGFRTKAEAKQAYLDFVEKYCESAKGNYIRQLINSDSASMQTLKSVIPAYLVALENQNKESSIYDKRNRLYDYIVPQLGDEAIKDLSTERLYKWQDTLWSLRNPRTGDFYSYSYLCSIRTTLNSLLSWLSERYQTENNLSKIRKPKRRTQPTEMMFWTREEFDRFISVVDNPTFRAMFNMLFFTGRRKGEVIALHSDDVSDRGIRFNKTYSRKTLDNSPYAITTTKNERRGLTPICKPLRTALADYAPQAPFFFGGDKPIHENTLTHAFERYIKKAGVKEIRMHDLRHSFVSMCIHLGASVYVVADLIGDTVEQVLKTYGHLYEEDKKNIIAKIE